MLTSQAKDTMQQAIACSYLVKGLAMENDRIRHKRKRDVEDDDDAQVYSEVARIILQRLQRLHCKVSRLRTEVQL